MCQVFLSKLGKIGRVEGVKTIKTSHYQGRQKDLARKTYFRIKS